MAISVDWFGLDLVSPVNVDKTFVESKVVSMVYKVANEEIIAVNQQVVVNHGIKGSSYIPNALAVVTMLVDTPIEVLIVSIDFNPKDV